ncbi:Phospholipase D alpha 1, partial [Sesamum angolense]
MAISVLGPMRYDMAPRLLHGTLHATIFEADRLQGGFSFSHLFGTTGNAQKKTKNLLSQFKRFVLCSPEIVGSRIYATIDLERARVGRTRVIQNEHSNPR